MKEMLAIILIITGSLFGYFAGWAHGYAEQPNIVPSYNFNLCVNTAVNSSLSVYYKKALIEQCIIQYKNSEKKQQEATK